MSERIEVTTEPELLKMSRGETAEYSITLKNCGKTVDQFTLSIDGLDPSWYKLPVSSVALFPNDQDTVKVIITLPEILDSGVSSYRFSVKAASQENPADTVTVALGFEVGAAPGLELNISPASISGRKGTYTVTVNNPDRKEHQVSLKSASRGRLRFNLQPESFTLAAGGSVQSSLNVKLNWLALLIGQKSPDFQIIAEQSDTPGAEIAAQNGQLVSTPWYKVFSRLRIPWFSRPPSIRLFEARTDNKREYLLKWEVRRANRVTLDDSDVEPQGESLVNPGEPRKYTLTAVSRYGSTSKTVEVKPLPVPQARASEKIKVSVSPAQLQTQAGLIPAQAVVQVQNLSSIVDKFIVDVDGLDSSWYSRSASSIALMPQASDQVQISFLPPKKKGVKSGSYTFAITVRSQTDAQVSASVIGTLEILPAVDYKLKIHPYRFSGMRKGNCSLTLANVGVSEAHISLEASDLDEGCTYEFKPQSLTLSAWNTVEVPIIIRPKRKSFFGEVKRFDITITASTENGAPVTTNCEFNHTPFIKSWKPVFRVVRAIVAIAVVVVAAYFIIQWGGGWDSLRSSPQTWFSNIVNSVEGWFN
jgi:hypothetical protein